LIAVFSYLVFIILLNVFTDSLTTYFLAILQNYFICFHNCSFFSFCDDFFFSFSDGIFLFRFRFEFNCFFDLFCFLFHPYNGYICPFFYFLFYFGFTFSRFFNFFFFSFYHFLIIPPCFQSLFFFSSFSTFPL